MEFKLPPGYRAWCHVCADPPYNKKTKIKNNEQIELFVDLQIPGLGFKTLEELQEHRNKIHDIRKQKKAG